LVRVQSATVRAFHKLKRGARRVVSTGSFKTSLGVFLFQQDVHRYSQVTISIATKRDTGPYHPPR